MKKVQFCCGPNRLDGWENYDRECDITKPLPFKDNSIDFAFCEHGQEHCEHQEAYRFLKELYRILKSKGVYLVIVPDVKKIFELADEDYLNFISESAGQWWPYAGMKWHGGKATLGDAMQTIVACHGHKGLYTTDLLLTFCRAVGFNSEVVPYGVSTYPELQGVPSHWKLMGLERAKMESVCVEAVKP